jgi:hypothetical protein
VEVAPALIRVIDDGIAEELSAYPVKQHDDPRVRLYGERTLPQPCAGVNWLHEEREQIRDHAVRGVHSSLGKSE